VRDERCYRCNDLRIVEKIEDGYIQRAPNAMQRERERGVGVTAIMVGKLMLYLLRSNPHKEHLVDELLLKGDSLE
jgi:hypothetical protein